MRYTIPKGFKLGANMPAWQVEGGMNKLEGHEHFPDLMYRAHPERWFQGYGPTRASEHYTHYEEDIKLLKASGCQQVRFNPDWSRFIKDFETGEVNEEEAAHYEKVIQCYIDNDIEPILCLEHWELPAYYYEHYDGYASRKVISMFVKYAEEIFKRYGHLVKHFFTFNEPIVIPQLCFMDGFWWPYGNNVKRAMNWIHGKILASAKVVSLYHQMNLGGKIGIIINPAFIYERSSDNPEDKKAKDIADSFYWGAFMDTAIKGEYPKQLLTILEKEGCMFDYEEEDFNIIKNNTIDILGLNYYQPLRVKEAEYAWNDNNFHFKKYYSEWEMPGKRMNPYRGWEIYPKALYDAAMRIKNEYGNIEWIVAESGMGVENEQLYKDEDGVIQDDYRIEYIKEHLAWLFKAIDEGCNCVGYWLFAGMDNCSPLNAFKNRYGLIEVDLEHDRKRRLKKSALFYNQTVQEQRFDYKDIDEDITIK
ncbi:beta-glucosidase/6-phospho-beta-glucosidase/beta-galactosidase [Breznakia sp. PF5-3]|uniref:glycoside hydrolase family 1 protein n=1 Tax=unclassified Breznakia TaxID=2623764 RepID=UPI002405821E|nr:MULTISPECIES: glycoside hydrolase family 1 protein [unclassified Breznakia]MDF9823855.1 beta-glucosidase/6-phospho-beta-glucosidase/beta-galactosidase [Breznakia sp. PM6-1]MDF9834579.1 beta-glucosidase/6-phospho-beta-glucosidase/beta-galactosidase [Breznakia sp. PF5-3]MDF9836804.1 beta-glucosidase/6-phospho-beta-glucosidase/beta-galactosidase [Breznakia sp. PFB2-8]MDF9858747.1 beta-glucosidase/6-phospho-beta-glucosidase/beta-galactosidase [Breznakia sp. PH5-24]